MADKHEAASAKGSADKDLVKDEAKSKSKSSAKGDKQKNAIGRLLLFLREVVAELRKVIWPTRKDLVTYTTVVLIFVVIMVAFISGLDFGLAKAVLYLFGDPDAESGS
ncbi:MAG: preprotein translocase subunit SecE [Corynebacteriales bacterium]|nr:preprotein translocase subunit SecE [Mycobacteriales bacterium]